MLEQLEFGLNIDFTFPADRSLEKASNADMFEVKKETKLFHWLRLENK